MESKIRKTRPHGIKWHEWFVYDEASPSCLYWKVDKLKKDGKRCRALAGGVAGTLTSRNRWNIRFELRNFSVYRIIWEMHYDTLKAGDVIDHIDGDSSNNKIENLRKVNSSVNARNVPRSTLNKSGVTGVYKTCVNGYYNYVAEGRHLDGTKWRKNFPILKLGEDEAFRLACECRTRMIEELNEQGAGYTERHGT